MYLLAATRTGRTYSGFQGSITLQSRQRICMYLRVIGVVSTRFSVIPGKELTFSTCIHTVLTTIIILSVYGSRYTYGDCVAQPAVNFPVKILAPTKITLNPSDRDIEGL